MITLDMDGNLFVPAKLAHAVAGRVRQDVRPGKALNGAVEVFVGGDDDLVSTLFEETQRRLDFWAHVPGRKLPSGVMMLDFRGCHGEDRHLRWRFVIQVN